MDDRKKTKAQLIAELEELRQGNSQIEHNTIINTTLDGYWEVDQTGKFKVVNDKYCEMSGFTRKELLACEFLTLKLLNPQMRRKPILKR